jgi:hypothetical protein
LDLSRAEISGPDLPRLPENAPYHLVILPLADNLDIRSYPAEADMDSAGVFPGKTVAQFAREIANEAAGGSSFAINASPFDVSGRGKERRTVGIHYWQEKILSPPLERYAALVFFDLFGQGRAAILSRQSDALPARTRLAVGGFFVILRDGAVIPFPAGKKDARSAAGVSRDGSVVYLLAARGERLLKKGFTPEDCAAILRDAGASDALLLDGGSSTRLVLGEKRYPRSPEWRPVGTILGFTLRPAPVMRIAAGIL